MTTFDELLNIGCGVGYGAAPNTAERLASGEAGQAVFDVVRLGFNEGHGDDKRNLLLYDGQKIGNRED